MKKKSKSAVVNFTSKRRIGFVRIAIIERLRQVGKNKLWLATKAGVREATVYDYLAGKQDVHLKVAEKLMSVLGLEVRAKE